MESVVSAYGLQNYINTLHVTLATMQNTKDPISYIQLVSDLIKTAEISQTEAKKRNSYGRLGNSDTSFVVLSLFSFLAYRKKFKTKECLGVVCKSWHALAFSPRGEKEFVNGNDFYLRYVTPENTRAINVPLMIPLDPKKEITLGREKEKVDFYVCTTVYPRMISRVHAKLIWYENLKKWKIFDMNSLSGLYINNLLVQEQFLEPNDFVRFGALHQHVPDSTYDCVYRFLIDEQ